MDEQTQKRELQMESTRREMYRKSLDTIRLYNPLDVTFKYMYDGYWHQVLSKGTKDEPRYLARHFFKKIAEFMIGQQGLLKGTELKELREKQLGKSFLDKYEENIEIWNKVPKLDDPELLAEIRDVVIMGVVEEYGLELTEEVIGVASKPIDFRPLSDQIFEESEKRVETPPSKYPINKKTDDL